MVNIFFIKIFSYTCMCQKVPLFGNSLLIIKVWSKQYCPHCKNIMNLWFHQRSGYTCPHSHKVCWTQSNTTRSCKQTTLSTLIFSSLLFLWSDSSNIIFIWYSFFPLFSVQISQTKHFSDFISFTFSTRITGANHYLISSLLFVIPCNMKWSLANNSLQDSAMPFFLTIYIQSFLSLSIVYNSHSTDAISLWIYQTLVHEQYIFSWVFFWATMAVASTL